MARCEREVRSLAFPAEVPLEPGEAEGLGGLVDREDVGEGGPREDAEGVLDIGRSAHAVQHASHAWSAGEHPECLAR
jgi:hypothetical protein